MSGKIDRIGEVGYNNFGSKMIIIEYRKYTDIDVYFPEYDWTFKGALCQSFKKGSIRCPYEPRVLNKGYLGEGKYKVSENRKITKVYDTWNSMLQRCYDEKHHKKEPTYKYCEVCNEWLNFQECSQWFDDNYYEIKGERTELDKDILVKHNKIYSPDTCVFVPKTINSLFTKNNKARGNSPIGTSLRKNGKYVSQCQIFNPKTGKSKYECLGVYDTQEKAFEVYKYYKEKNIKEVADYYFGRIPIELYDALYRYEVEITD